MMAVVLKDAGAKWFIDLVLEFLAHAVRYFNQMSHGVSCKLNLRKDNYEAVDSCVLDIINGQVCFFKPKNRLNP